MDSWSEIQITQMRKGGNNKCNSFLAEYNIKKDTPIPTKYNNKVALFYRSMLSADAEGREIPSPPSDLGEADQSSSSNSGEDPVQRELRLREEARERMRQKFGGTKGLSSSGGVMQGIGSDNYRPGASSDSNNGPALPSVDMAQLANASQQAFSFLSTQLAVVSERVAQTTAKLLEEPPKPSDSNSDPVPSSTKRSESGGGGGSSTSSSRPAGASNEAEDEWGKNAWSMLSTGAASIWKVAAETTTELLNTIKQPGDEEEDARFPRPPGAPAPSQTKAANVNNNSNSNNNGGMKEVMSWDSLSDIVGQQRPATTEDTSPSTFSPPPASKGMALSSKQERSISSGSGKSNRSGQASPAPLPPRPAAGGDRSNSSGTNTPGGSIKPAGSSNDDFFGTFGL